MSRRGLGCGIEHDNWYGLYKERWNNEIVPEAMAHPAKFSRALIRKIYQHAREEGWLLEGGRVIDPFGGVGLGALEAMVMGADWVGVEIEPKFVTLGMGGECDGRTKLVDGDTMYSGYYISVGDEETPLFIGSDLEVSNVVPLGDRLFSDMDAALSVLGSDAGTVEFIDEKSQKLKPALCGSKKDHETHHVQGNIELWDVRYKDWLPKWGSARLIQGDSRYLAKVLRDNGELGGDVAASSPPFAGTLARDTTDKGDRVDLAREKGISNAEFITPIDMEDVGKRTQEYGNADGNLANMPVGDASLGLTSPPYAGARIDGQGDEGSSNLRDENGNYLRGSEGWEKRKEMGGRYGDQDGNLANLPADQFDSAVASPPFTQGSADGGWQMLGKYAEQGKLTVKQVGGDPNKSYPSWDKERDTSYGHSEGQMADMETGDLDAAISSPPFIAQSGGTNVTAKEGPLSDGRLIKRHSAGNSAARGYGEGDGNLGNMPDKSYDLSLNSPPYGDTAQSGGTKGLIEHGTGLTRGERHFDEYGETEGQLGRMPTDQKSYDLSANSPPFESTLSNRPSPNIIASGLKMGASSMGDGYGETAGNIGETYGEDFWTASRMILDNLFHVIKPGGHAIFVLKRYVKNKRLVYFPRQWAKLCVAAGFVPLHWHRAWVVEDRGAQYDIFGNLIVRQVARKSFFRMLAEKKGSPAIDWEDVICFYRP